ncbi:plasmid maintenance system antidote protein [Novosphingobium sp. SG707]|uniref:plasmid maintenance system antidote protein n=1 Tax=Novosphingobium sp. SG707 TaxID=2586996 RepID=UPI0014485919|nr:plasmid maintenance system antidote protein [Novosphingobium sp. SG707]NKJ02878.1 plasmid maintenance system antidote protein VapI [Novosphingobium sp. SG707]
MTISFQNGFGIKADTLLRMQAACELAQVRAHENEIGARGLTTALAASKPANAG